MKQPHNQNRQSTGAFSCGKGRLRAPACALFLALLFLLPLPALAGEWTLFYDKGGILGYEKEVPGSDFYAYKAQGMAGAGMDVIAQVLRDVSAYPKWLTQCSKADVIERYDENRMLLHILFDSPWPVSDRDAVVENSFALDPDGASAVIEIMSKDGVGPPPPKGAIRIPRMEGKITLEYMGRDRTRITYENHADPGGSLSPSMVKMTARYYPVQYLQGICALAAEPRYKEQAKASREAANLDRFAADPKKNAELLKTRCTVYVQNDPVTRAVVTDPGSVPRLLACGSKYEGMANEVARALDACLSSSGPSSLFADQDLVEALVRPKVGPRIKKRQQEAIDYMFISGESLEESLSRLAEGIARDRDYKEVEKYGP